MSSVGPREVEVATDLAQRASAVVLRYFQTDLSVDEKRGHEPVTEADRESQAVVVSGLREAFPDDGILSEESRDHTSWRQHRRSWVVDPLDGTKDFIAGLDGFSVMIGLLEDSRPVLGVVHQPATGLTFRTTPEGTAEMLQGGQRQPLRVGPAGRMDALRLVVSNSHRSDQIDEVKRVLGISDEMRVGSVGLKISLIARGIRDLYVHPGSHTKLWDTCAPEALVVAAGGRMTDLYGAPLDYASGEVRILRGLVASNGPCHDAVIEQIAPLFPRDAG